MRRIGDRLTSDVTGVSAVFRPDATADGQGAWVLSAMPERLLTEDQARSAMVLADIYARNPAPAPAGNDALWEFVRTLREELGLPRDVPAPASGRWGAEVWSPYSRTHALKVLAEAGRRHALDGHDTGPAAEALRQAVLGALAVGVTVPDAARTAGIAPETVARWSRDQAQADSTKGC